MRCQLLYIHFGVYLGRCEGDRQFEKHGVSLEEAAIVFGDGNGLDWDDPAHSDQERRFKRLGRSVSERLLLVVYTVRGVKYEKDSFRIISARPASRRERQAYTRRTD